MPKKARMYSESMNEEPKRAPPGTDTNHELPAAVPAEHFEPPKKHLGVKQKILFLVVVALLGGAAAAYLLVFKGEPEDTADRPGASQRGRQDDKKTASAGRPDTVAYSFASDGNAPPSLYWRPAESGERTEVLKLQPQSYVIDWSMRESRVAVVIEERQQQKILYSQDGGRSYETIFTGKKAPDGQLGEQVTSIIFSSDSRSIVIGLLAAPGGFNAITQIVLSGENEASELHRVSQAGVFLEGYDPINGKLIYFTGCYNCDGNFSDTLYITDLKNKITNQLISSDKFNFDIQVREDFQELLLVKNDRAFSGLGEENLLGQPYEISKLDIASKKETKLAVVGAKGALEQTPPFGDPVAVSAGYIANQKDVFFVADKKLYALRGQLAPSLLFESQQPIGKVYFAGDDTVIAATGDIYQDFVLSRFDVKTQALATILNGDANTRIFGVSLK